MTYRITVEFDADKELTELDLGALQRQMRSIIEYPATYNSDLDAEEFLINADWTPSSMTFEAYKINKEVIQVRKHKHITTTMGSTG